MPQDPDMPDLDALMQDYGAPLADDGFSDIVVAKAAKVAALRRRLILGACFAGGLIMASRIKALGGLMTKFTASPDAASANMSTPFEAIAATFGNSASGTIALYACAAMLGLVTIWLAKEALDSQI